MKKKQGLCTIHIRNFPHTAEEEGSFLYHPANVFQTISCQTIFCQTIFCQKILALCHFKMCMCVCTVVQLRCITIRSKEKRRNPRWPLYITIQQFFSMNLSIQCNRHVWLGSILHHVVAALTMTKRKYRKSLRKSRTTPSYLISISRATSKIQLYQNYWYSTNINNEIFHLLLEMHNSTE